MSYDRQPEREDLQAVPRPVLHRVRPVDSRRVGELRSPWERGGEASSEGRHRQLWTTSTRNAVGPSSFPDGGRRTQHPELPTLPGSDDPRRQPGETVLAVLRMRNRAAVNTTKDPASGGVLLIGG